MTDVAGGITRDPSHADGLEQLRRVVRIRLRRQATTLAHDHSHTLRVVASAQRIAEALTAETGEPLDGDALEAACLLHEIGRGAERAGESPVEGVVRVAEEMLRHEGLGELVWPVCEALAQHLTPGREPESDVARCLHDADILEDLGPIGLARAIAEAVAEATPMLYDPEDPEARERELDSATYVLDRVPQRLLKLPPRCATTWGRAEAERRARVLAAYHKAFLRDAGLE